MRLVIFFKFSFNFYNSFGFCHAPTQINLNYANIPFFPNFLPFPPSHPFRSSYSTRLGSLCCTESSHQLSILHLIVYICWYYFLHLSYSLTTSLCPQIHSLHLHLTSVPANRFINTIFLDSIYMCENTVFIFLFLTHFTLYNRF